jgi:hypothetical protein
VKSNREFLVAKPEFSRRETGTFSQANRNYVVAAAPGPIGAADAWRSGTDKQ